MTNDIVNNVYNPDVLSCLVNLSNDEVFTSPEVANKMLDMLPQELFSNPETRFLDPTCKTGVFLREIAKRLINGLEKQIPDLEKRVEHICKEQLFGIAITELTGLISRRTLYCSKIANSEYSIPLFDSEEGNIRYIKKEHKWVKGKCKYCGANEKQYKREKSLETHAYEFIHVKKPEEIFDMKFDVVIGNPPYHLSTGGGQAQATPLYDKFVESAMKLKPRYITMIIPSRWYAGGFPCIKTFRKTMTSCNQVKVIHDYKNASDCFAGVEIKGGVCYFLWDRDYNGPCEFNNHSGDEIISSKKRKMLEAGCDTVIRDNKAISIYKKVYAKREDAFSTIVGTLWPFTTNSSFDSLSENKEKDDDIYAYVKKNQGWIRKKEIVKNKELVNKVKLLLPRSVGSADASKDRVKPILARKNTCCSGTYIICGPFNTIKQAKNVKSYIETKFFHFLLSQKKVSQDTVRGCYDLIPIQDFSEEWNDQKLYKKYNLSQREINYIESTVWPGEED